MGKTHEFVKTSIISMANSGKSRPPYWTGRARRHNYPSAVQRRRPPLSDFEKDTQESEGTKATAHLPGLTIEIVHRQSAAGDAEHISVNLQAVPSFEAFGRHLEAANPFAFWLQASRMAWFPWLEAARVAMLPFGGAASLPKAGSPARSPQEPRRE
jgi:hypothetical protein